MSNSKYFTFDVTEMAWVARHLGASSKVDYYLGMKGKWAKLPVVRSFLLFLAGVRLSQSEMFALDVDSGKLDLKSDCRKDMETLLTPVAILQLAVNPLSDRAEMSSAHLGADGERVISVFTDVETSTQTINRMTRSELVEFVVKSSDLLPEALLPQVYVHSDLQISLNELVKISDPLNNKPYPQVSPVAQRIALVLSDLKRRGSVIISYGLRGDKGVQPESKGMIFLAGNQSGACFSFSPMMENARGAMFSGTREAFALRLRRMLDEVWRPPVQETQC